MSLASNSRVTRAVSFGRALFELYRDRDIPFMAGSIAYAAFVSLIPAIVLLFIAASIVGGQALQEYVLSFTGQYLTLTSQGVLRESIVHATEQVEFSILALVALLWAVLKVFRTLDVAFSKLYHEGSTSGIFTQVANGLIVIAGMTAASLAMFVVGAVIALASAPINVGLPPIGRGVELLSITMLLVGLTVAFIPVYYVFPSVEVTIREIIPGAVFAAVGWTVLQGLFQLYVSMASTSRLYGAIGAVIIVITWLYFGAVIVLLGAATNVVLAGRFRQFDDQID